MERRLIARGGVLASLLVALFMPAQFAANAETVYPIGTRLSLPAERDLTLQLGGDGPSVIWVMVEAPHLQSVTLNTAEATTTVEAIFGRAAAILPLYAPGVVTARLIGARDGRVLVTTAYGVGGIVSPGELPPAAEARASAPPAGEEPEARAPERAAKSERRKRAPHPPAPPTPATETKAAQPPPVEIAAPVIETGPIAPAETTRTAALFFNDQIEGMLTTASPAATYRVYIPARNPFRVIVMGAGVAARVTSANGGYDETRRETGVKQFAIGAPEENFYLVTVRGSGVFSIAVMAE